MRRTPLKDMRCVSCGEYLGRNSVSCTHGPFCSTSCEGQSNLRQDEARDSLICEQWASGDMDQVEIGIFHGLSKQTVNWIIQHF